MGYTDWMDEGLEGIPKVGEVLLSKYRVEGILGKGGMGAVVAATHLGLQQPVAIKFMLVHRSTNPVSRQRFEREARAAAAIRSEHVCRVMDVGVLDSGMLYLVMEHLSGSDVQVVLKEGPLSLEVAVKYLLQACEALAQAHQLGIVHRDLKPANLFVSTGADGEPCVKLLDFGISKLTQDFETDIESLTKTAAMMGSPLYMAPEQMVSAKAVDVRADVWAMGCIFYEMLTGRPPFLAKLLPEVCMKVLQEQAPSFESLGVSDLVSAEAVCSRCLQKEPVERYRDVAELAHELAELGDAESKRLAAKIQRILTPLGGVSEEIEVGALAATAPSNESLDKEAASKAHVAVQSAAATTHSPLSRNELESTTRSPLAKSAGSRSLLAAGIMLGFAIVFAVLYGRQGSSFPVPNMPSASAAKSRLATPKVGAQRGRGGASAGRPIASAPVQRNSRGVVPRRPVAGAAKQPVGEAGGKAVGGPGRKGVTKGASVGPPPKIQPKKEPGKKGGNGLFDKRDPSADLFGERAP